MKKLSGNEKLVLIMWVLVIILCACSTQLDKYNKDSDTFEETTSTYQFPQVSETTLFPVIDTSSVTTFFEEITSLVTSHYEEESTETTTEEINLTECEIRYNELCETYSEEIESDIWYLTCFLYGECRGSNQTLQSCCAWVVLNAKGGTKPGNLKNAVTYYSNGTYWSNYITSFGNYNWSHEWTATTGKKTGKVFHLNSKLQTVEEKNPSGWAREKKYATDVYHRWLKELSGYPAEEVGRTIPKRYLHFWNDKKAKTGTVFPADWGQRYDHTKDFKIDYENSPYK